ncbi:hypothetical protein JSY14_02755 [Brachybacterium sp. EF45031]|uniref:TadE/TadG family type IV pilus assembly protein n=1 Tax=Brachybacterium sillae TaxID=2810536 RepID=UPI00217ED669|nr:hypothetical protein [Brachybacterium sillae]MCS6710986.1 hypothetical protein [Brachybacterium sillae]
MLAEDSGSMLVEFVALSVLLLIPMLYLVVSLGSAQAALFAADTIARDAARHHATAPDAQTATLREQQMTRQVLEDHGLPAGAATVEIICSDTPCSAPGGDVRAEVAVQVPIPGLGPVLGDGGPIRISATHLARVDLHRAAEGAAHEPPRPRHSAPRCSGPLCSRP